MGFTPILPFRDYSSILKVNSREREVIFVENDNSESEDDSSVDSTTSSSDDFRENRIETHVSTYKFFTLSLEDLRNVLNVALNPYFEEFEIAVISCPCLTSEPYNLAAAGLSGNTGILELGAFKNFFPSPRTDLAFDIRYMLSRCNDDVFVIGSGFAARPLMPYNGYLTINAVVSANPTNVINNSCIAYEDASIGQRRSKIINDNDRIRCSIIGQFYFSEGKRGPVIKMRAKGRKSRSNIIALIQAALVHCYQYEPLIGLGIVLVINGGQTIQFLLRNNFVNHNYNRQLNDWIEVYPFECINLIALGAVISKELTICGKKKTLLRDETSMFNVLPNSKSMGNFINDLTPEETEYIVYINLAQESSLSM